jgi:hypothetical protein
MNFFLSILIFPLLQSTQSLGIAKTPEASGTYYYQNNANWVPLQPAPIDKMKTKGMELFLATGGYTRLGASGVYHGAKAALRISVPKPTFFVRAAGSYRNAALIRLVQKKDSRTFHTSSSNISIENRGGFNKGDIRKVFVVEYPDSSFSLTPEENLSPGEYLLVFGGAASGFDFGIDKTK